MVCNENFDPGQKVVRADHFWPLKFCPGGPTLAAKIGPTQLKWSSLENQ